MGSPKLSIPKQVEDMKKKGIKFEVCTEAEARRFLSDHNYYYKLKAYAHNYEVYKEGEKRGQYINLDFAYLKDLSTIDARFRKTILSMSIDLEHFLKVRMLNHFNQVDEDGYEIIRELFRLQPELQDKIEEKSNTSTCHSIVDKHHDDWAIWNIVELMSFGQFIELYNLFYNRNKFKNTGCGLLYSVKMLRNAAAHNNCLINQMRGPYSRPITPTYELKNKIYKMTSSSKDVAERHIQHPTVHDFLALLTLYDIIVPEPTKTKGFKEVGSLFEERMLKNGVYYEKNQVLLAKYEFVREIVDKFVNQV